jgi:7-cyano-7-deazaguanine synthase in queuosine biosynthesis
MTAEKFFVVRHPEFHRRAAQDLREVDETDFEDIIAVVPYQSSEFSLDQDYSKRKPPKADEYIKYDHSILQHQFDREVPDIILDIVEIAVATFAADKAVSRGINIQENFDDSKLETRNIKVQIPVLSSRIATGELEELYSEMMSHMTHDVIEYEFLKVDTKNSVEQNYADSDVDAVSLLSDGLDSTAGIYHNKSESIDSNYITVNYGQGAGSKAGKIAEETGISHRINRVKFDGRGESTQFSRGLLHLSFGVAASSADGINEVRSFENGIMARFLILSEGWLTTKTVSPLFVAYFNEILSDVLDLDVQITNPFLDLTKTDIVNKIPDESIVRKTVSCPHSARFGGSNCGFCVPCLIRNVGIISSKHNIPLTELSKYNPVLSADFESQSLDLDSSEIKNPAANSPEIFFKGITEIAYFCRQVLAHNPRELAVEYPDLLDEQIYTQHLRFANNFTNALTKVSEENPTIQYLLPDE